jgi:hypothetical protein
MRSTGGGRLWPAILFLALVFAGVLHLVLTEEHTRASATLGAGFVIAGLAQLVLGALSLRSDRAPYAAIVTLNVILIALYLMHVTTGLPLPDAAEDSMRGLIGAREEIEPSAIATKVAELVGIAVALRGMRQRAAVSEEVAVRRAA